MINIHETHLYTIPWAISAPRWELYFDFQARLLCSPSTWCTLSSFCDILSQPLCSWEVWFLSFCNKFLLNNLIKGIQYHVETQYVEEKIIFVTLKTHLVEILAIQQILRERSLEVQRREWTHQSWWCTELFHWREELQDEQVDDEADSGSDDCDAGDVLDDDDDLDDLLNCHRSLPRSLRLCLLMIKCCVSETFLKFQLRNIIILAGQAALLSLLENSYRRVGTKCNSELFKIIYLKSFSREEQLRNSTSPHKILLS